MWMTYAEMGLLGLPFAESDGGLGGGPVDTMIVMEAIGRALVLEPYLRHYHSCRRLSARGRAAQRNARSSFPRSRPGIAARLRARRAQSRYELANVRTSAKRDGDQWVLDGSKRFVLHGDSADKLIVSARICGRQRDRDGLALFLVDAAARRHRASRLLPAGSAASRRYPARQCSRCRHRAHRRSRACVADHRAGDGSGASRRCAPKPSA